MSTIEIVVEDYLSEADRRQIVSDEFRRVATMKCREDFERMLSNAAYKLVQKEVDAAFDGNMVETVKAKALEVINTMSLMTVFKRPDAWDREASKGWTYLQSAVEDMNPLIYQRVREIIEDLDMDILRDTLMNRFVDRLLERVTTPAAGSASV